MLITAINASLIVANNVGWICKLCLSTDVRVSRCSRYVGMRIYFQPFVCMKRACAAAVAAIVAVVVIAVVGMALHC